jgi:hypothetical protein
VGPEPARPGLVAVREAFSVVGTGNASLAWSVIGG